MPLSFVSIVDAFRGSNTDADADQEPLIVHIDPVYEKPGLSQTADAKRGRARRNKKAAKVLGNNAVLDPKTGKVRDRKIQQSKEDADALEKELKVLKRTNPKAHEEIE